ncbi:hypothetical protein CCR75_008548 [Bremia lactucae]|uniref:OTU domain-containing protein n=1 Tax=Bremia lactucae TaxID=4779 RepID=A0A976IGQ0_BRELC|nr:hypothetical protein CCR75_008548 [Bremia lactucae]
MSFASNGKDIKTKSLGIDIESASEDELALNIFLPGYIHHSRLKDLSSFKLDAESTNEISNRQGKTAAAKAYIEANSEVALDVDGDGNCGFRAIAVAPGRSEFNWPAIRKELAKELIDW